MEVENRIPPKRETVPYEFLNSEQHETLREEIEQVPPNLYTGMFQKNSGYVRSGFFLD